MKTGRAEALLLRLQTTVAERGLDRLDDAELLQRFAASRDGEAIATLVRRHGAMVRAVARRQLRDPADADDVFQATFLVLTRRARSLPWHRSVANWLYTVAFRLSRRARADTSRRRDRELRAALDVSPARPTADPSAEISLREAQQVLDEELSRLPEKYRAPLVLCCLEGLARDEAARRLGWSSGLVKSRLEQARERLHARLVRRGLTLSAALTAGLLAEGSVAARPLPSFPAISPGLVSPRALALATGGGLRLWLRWTAGAMLVVLTAVTGAATFLAPPVTGAAQRPEQDATPTGHRLSGPVPVATDSRGDPLPEGARFRLGTVRFRDGGSIHNAALSPDGKTLATLSHSGVTLWDPEAGRALHRYPQSRGIAFSLVADQPICFAPDGKTAANFEGWEGVGRGFEPGPPGIVVWDVASGKELRRFPLAPGRELVGRSLWFVPGSGEIAVVATWDGEVRFLDPITGIHSRQFASECYALLPSPDRKTIAGLGKGDGKLLRLLDAATGKEIYQVKSEAKWNGLAFSPDGSTLATSDESSVIRLLAAATGKEKLVLRVKFPDQGSDREIRSLAFSPDSRTLYAGTGYGVILRWDAGTGAAAPELGTARKSIYAGVRRLLFPPDGRSLVSVGDDGLIRRWDVASGKERPGVEGFDGHALAVQSPDGRLIAAGDVTGRLETYDAATGRRLVVLCEGGSELRCLLWTPDGSRLLTSATGDRVTLWDARAGREERSFPLPAAAARKPGDSHLRGAAFSPDGRFLFTSQSADGVRMWGVATGKEVWQQPGSGYLAISPDGKTLVTADMQSPPVIRDAATGRVRRAAEQGTRITVNDFVAGLAVSPDGRSFATSTHDGTVHFYDVHTGKELRRTKATGILASGVAFSPDGKWLIAGDIGGSVRLWEVATAKELFRRDGHTGWATNVGFSPDGRSALSSSLDKTALLWDLRPSGSPARSDHDSLWEDLASDDAAKAYRAVWQLADEPKRAAPLLRAKLISECQLPDETRVRRLVAELDAETFAEREKATKELLALGPAVAPQLRKLSEGAGSVEGRRRLAMILSELAPPDPGPSQFRRMRAVQALELAATTETRQLLRDFAAGPPGTQLTDEARAALRRLSGRPRS
jgi:RNA polymerase sigma factor (sigma-70 family)